MRKSTFRRNILIKKLLEKQGRTEEKLRAAGIEPLELNLHNTTVYDIIKIIEEVFSIKPLS